MYSCEGNRNEKATHGAKDRSVRRLLFNAELAANNKICRATRGSRPRIAFDHAMPVRALCGLSYSVVFTSVSFVTCTVSPSSVPSTATITPFLVSVSFNKPSALSLPALSSL